MSVGKESESGRKRRDIIWGVRWGLFYAVGMTIFSLLSAAVRLFWGPGDGWVLQVGLPVLIAVYFLVGVVAGALVGLCRNWLHFWIARRLIGMLIGIGWGFTIHFSLYDFSLIVDQPVQFIITFGAIWGLVMSFIPE